MQPKLRNIQDVLFLYEAYREGMKLPSFTGYIFVDAQDHYYSGRVDKPKLQMTLKEYDEGLTPVADALVYPPVTKDVDFFVFPNDLVDKHLYFKRPTHAMPYFYSSEERVAYDAADRVPKIMLEEVRNLEYLSACVRHPGLVRYHGCRVHRGFITSIVLDRHITDLARHMSAVLVYDEDDPYLANRVFGSGETDNDVRFGREGFFDELDEREEPAPINKERFMATIRDAVARLHTIGWAHNSIRPGNILVSQEGLPVLASFESCRPVGEPLKFTRGMSGWIENDNHAGYTTSDFQHDLYALDQLDKWLDEMLENQRHDLELLAQQMAQRKLEDAESNTLHQVFFCP